MVNSYNAQNARKTSVYKVQDVDNYLIKAYYPFTKVIHIAIDTTRAAVKDATTL